jgi:hypothetical protein
MIPDFRDDGYLPEGLHLATEAEVASRFGDENPRRRRLMPRLRRWLKLAREVGVRRFMVGGSFATAKSNPGDIDAAVLLPEDFRMQVADGDAAATELDEMFRTRHPQEIHPAHDEVDWEDWYELFRRTREEDGRTKGVVEVEL